MRAFAMAHSCLFGSPENPMRPAPEPTEDPAVHAQEAMGAYAAEVQLHGRAIAHRGVAAYGTERDPRV
jgi:hypothetical protein